MPHQFTRGYWITYPTLLDFPAAQLSGYPRETVVAEKFHAMVYLRTTNSRMKDFYDVWLLASEFPCDGAQLATAVGATFANRGTSVDLEPIAFTSEFTEQVGTLTQWSAFRRRLSSELVPATLSEVVAVISAFLKPVAQACAENLAFDLRWEAGGPWSRSAASRE